MPDSPDRPKKQVSRQTSAPDASVKSDSVPSLGSELEGTPDLTSVLSSHQRHAARASTYAHDMLVAAARACADSLALRLPPTSREAAHRTYERQLLREFRAAYDRLGQAWLGSDDL